MSAHRIHLRRLRHYALDESEVDLVRRVLQLHRDILEQESARLAPAEYDATVALNQRVQDKLQ